MTKSNQPEKHTNADEPPAGKRQRRPSVRFGEIGGYVSSDSNRKVSNKNQNSGKQIKNKDSKNAKNSEVNEIETLGGEKEGRLEPVKSKKSLVSNTKRIRSNLMNVDGKAGKDGGDEFRVSDSDTDNPDSENLEIEKQEKSKTKKTTKRIRTDRDEGNEGNEGFRVSDSDNSEEDLGIENGDDGNAGNGVRKGVRVLEEPSENGEGNGVKGWLDQLGLGRYGPVFDVHEVDEEVLPLLTLEDLKDMGINAVGSRRKIFAYIQKLRE
ncbi:hypothetical protein AgCh_011270 [Apium graveolens]